MPSKRIYSPGLPPVARAGSDTRLSRPETQVEIDAQCWQLLPAIEETDRLIREAGENQRQQMQRFLAQSDVVDDLADLDLDDPRFLIIEAPQGDPQS